MDANSKSTKNNDLDSNEIIGSYSIGSEEPIIIR